MHNLIPDNTDARTEGVVQLMHRFKNIEASIALETEARRHHVTSVEKALEHQVLRRNEENKAMDFRLTSQIGRLERQIDELRNLLGSTTTISVSMETLKSEVARLRSEMATRTSQVQGGWWTLTLIASLVMGAFSILKQFLH